VSVAAPRRKKPTSDDETARVLRIFDWLREGMQKRDLNPVITDVTPDGAIAAVVSAGYGLLDIADRIAARTEG